MYRRHVYSDAGLITPAFVGKKQDVARRPGAVSLPGGRLPGSEIAWSGRPFASVLNRSPADFYN
jgi:hypothetical protein